MGAKKSRVALKGEIKVTSEIYPWSLDQNFKPGRVECPQWVTIKTYEVYPPLGNLSLANKTVNKEISILFFSSQPVSNAKI